MLHRLLPLRHRSALMTMSVLEATSGLVAQMPSERIGLAVDEYTRQMKNDTLKYHHHHHHHHRIYSVPITVWPLCIKLGIRKSLLVFHCNYIYRVLFLRYSAWPWNRPMGHSKAWLHFLVHAFHSNYGRIFSRFYTMHERDGQIPHDVIGRGYASITRGKVGNEQFVLCSFHSLSSIDDVVRIKTQNRDRQKNRYMYIKEQISSLVRTHSAYTFSTTNIDHYQSQLKFVPLQHLYA